MYVKWTGKNKSAVVQVTRGRCRVNADLTVDILNVDGTMLKAEIGDTILVSSIKGDISAVSVYSEDVWNKIMEVYNE